MKDVILGDQLKALVNEFLESFTEDDLNLEQVHGVEEFQKPLPMGKKKSRKKKPKNGEVVISEYAKRQAELAAAVEEDARKILH